MACPRTRSVIGRLFRKAGRLLHWRCLRNRSSAQVIRDAIAFLVSCRTSRPALADARDVRRARLHWRMEDPVLPASTSPCATSLASGRGLAADTAFLPGFAPAAGQIVGFLCTEQFSARPARRRLSPAHRPYGRPSAALPPRWPGFQPSQPSLLRRSRFGYEGGKLLRRSRLPRRPVREPGVVSAPPACEVAHA